MKRFKKVFVALITSAALLVSSLAIAQGYGGMRRQGPGFAGQQQGFQGPGRVLWQEMYEARVQVLADLSGLSSEEIKDKLNYKPMWAVLDETKVDYKTFQTKMHEKAQEVVKKAVADGNLTKVQGDYMLERMANGPQQGMGFGNKGFGKKGRGFGRGNCAGGFWN